jgi:glucosamine-6-phosphate deaminase
MHIQVFDSVSQMGSAAADRGATAIAEALRSQGHANIIVATGTSQFSVLEALTTTYADLDWKKVHAYHLDEYVGIDNQHPASFCRYLRERFVDKIPLQRFLYINGMAADPEKECQRLNQAVDGVTFDVAFVGIGENGHLAFNDPPANFHTHAAYHVVDLDEACRQQQFGEGWFPTLEDVPKKAISMTIHEILRSKVIICSVPDQRKAHAVLNTVQGPVTPDVPASILQYHPATYLHLDHESAVLLKNLS